MNVTTEIHQQIINKLFAIYQTRGFISEDDVLDTVVEFKLTLEEIDIISEQLLAMGVVIRIDTSIDDEIEYDRSQIDYNSLFEEVISIEPELKTFTKQVSRIQPPQHRELINLLPQAKNGNKYACTRLFEMHLRIVIKAALSYKQQYELSDVVQEGCIGLMTAIKRFDHGKSNNFSAYAALWIRQSITRAIADKARIIRLPAHIVETLNLIHRAYRHFLLKSECEPTVKDIAGKMGFSPEKINELIRISQETISLETMMDEEVGYHVNLIDDDMLTSIEDEVDFEILKEQFDDVLKTLTSREEDIVRLRFGLDGGRQRTLDEVGEKFSVTRERIRQIETRALRKLRHQSLRRKLENFIKY